METELKVRNPPRLNESSIRNKRKTDSRVNAAVGEI